MRRLPRGGDSPLEFLRRPWDRQETRCGCQYRQPCCGGSELRAGPLVGAAKAVSSEVDRLRRAKDTWTGEASGAAEARLDELFDTVEAQLARIVDDATAQVDAQFEAQSADIRSTRKRFERVRRLRSSVRSALEAIDLVLIRRLLALAGGDPAAIRRVRRTPGVELRVWTDVSRIAEVRACLQDQFVDVLTERIEICSESGSLDTRGASEGKADD